MAAASPTCITVTYKTLPSATPANVWLRWPYLVVCDGALVQVFDVHTPTEGSSSAGDSEAGSAGDSFPQCVHQFSLARYHTGAAESGRGANVLHGLDVRAGCLVGGTASGLVLHVVLPPTLVAGAEPVVRELVGHTKVVGFVQLAHAPEDDLAYSSSLDRTVRSRRAYRAAASDTQACSAPPSASASPRQRATRGRRATTLQPHVHLQPCSPAAPQPCSPYAVCAPSVQPLCRLCAVCARCGSGRCGRARACSWSRQAPQCSLSRYCRRHPPPPPPPLALRPLRQGPSC